MLHSFINSFINLGIREDFDPETIRQYRQVNILNIYFTLVALTGVVIMPVSGFPIILAIIQSIFVILFSGLGLTHWNKLKIAKYLVLFVFELQVYFFSFIIVTKFNNSFYFSEVLFLTFLYPLLAGLLDLSIFLHLGITLFQIILFFIIGNQFSFIFEWTIGNVPVFLYTFNRFLTILYSPIMGATIMAIVHRENLHARKKIQEDALYKIDLVKKIETEVNARQLDIDKREEAMKEKEKVEKELSTKVEELQKINQLMVGRELTMSELKKENAILKQQLGNAN